MVMALIPKFERGTVVWGKISTGSVFWPGIVVHGFDFGSEAAGDGKEWVFWFDIQTVTKVDIENIKDFIFHYRLYKVDLQLTNYYKGLAWAFIVCEEQKYFEPDFGVLLVNFQKARNIGVPFLVKSHLNHIKRAQLHYGSGLSNPLNIDKDIQQQDDSKLFPIDMSKYYEDFSVNVITQPTSWEFLDPSRGVYGCKQQQASQCNIQLSFLDKITKGLIKVSDVCICCKTTIEKGLQKSHPLFNAKCCDICYERVKYTMYTIGEDNIHIYCAVCAQTGKMFICDQKSCGRVFCFHCIKIFWGDEVHASIIDGENWVCFLCNGSTNEALLSPNKIWQITVINLFQTSEHQIIKETFEIPKRKLRVLSVFDGISAGLVALEKLGFELDVYYACEIDKKALTVSMNNHKSKPYFKTVGNIKKITSQTLSEFGHIDLLIGGSPCNDLSLVNPARKGLFDSSGTGIYFFDYIRILNILKNIDEGFPVFWLFENVASMPKKFQEVMSSWLECTPTVVNAKYYSPQSRARLFWGNIPGLSSVNSINEFQSDKDLTSYLAQLRGRVATVDKINTITTNPNSLRQGPFNTLPVVMSGKPDTLWITEIENIFGFPVHYTDIGNLSIYQRQALLGKSWSVPVICQLLLPLRNFFILKEGLNKVPLTP